MQANEMTDDEIKKKLDYYIDRDFKFQSLREIIEFYALRSEMHRRSHEREKKERLAI